jgi:hypothetical protein
MPGQTSAIPKRPAGESVGRAAVYPYYAGFSFDWAVQTLSTLDLDSDSLVLDGWSGGGTTAAAASSLGVPSIGTDLNPVPLVAAAVRLAGEEVAEQARRLDPAIPAPTGTSTPLGLTWLAPRSAEAFGAVHASLLHQAAACEPTDETSRATLRAAVTLISFMALRRLTAAFEGTNPTWVRAPGSLRRRLRPSALDVEVAFVAEVSRLGDALEVGAPALGVRPSLLCASSEALPLPDSSVSAVLTSPPYCTRIDYAVATRRELEVLGISGPSFVRLRRRLLGTTLNRPTSVGMPELGHTGSALLSAIEHHSGRDSGGYYLKHFLQYFDGLSRSLEELARVVRVGGTVVMVLQDSYYYDIHIQLGRIVSECCDRYGLELVSSAEVPVRRNLITMNTKARERRGDAEVAESVLTFEKSVGAQNNG